MKLGAVYIPEQVNALYRIVLPMMALQRRGHEIVAVEQRRGEPLPLATLADCDYVHVHRLLLVDDEDDCVARLRDADVVVGFDDDDDSEAVTPALERVVAEGSAAIARRDFARILARAPQTDLVTTPSERIAERFAAAGARHVEVIDNYLPEAFLQVAPAGHEGVVIGWHGCVEHRLDADALHIGDVLAAILDAHPEVRVVTIGGVDLALDHERYRHEETVPFDRLTQRLADVDVGIVPLADTPFNRGRSNVKAREYAAAGVPWLASPVGSYEQLGGDEGGELVQDHEWFDALDRLLRGRRERRRRAKRAKAWARHETIAQMAEVWEDAFLDALARQRVAA